MLFNTGQHMVSLTDSNTVSWSNAGRLTQLRCVKWGGTIRESQKSAAHLDAPFPNRPDLGISRLKDNSKKGMHAFTNVVLDESGRGQQPKVPTAAC